MRKLIFFAGLLMAMLFWCVPTVQAQGTSDEDTLRFGTAYGLPGDTVAMKIYLTNASFDVASWNLQYRFDTTYIRPIVQEDAGNFYAVWDLIGVLEDWTPFPAVGAELRYFPDNILGHLIRGVFVGDPDNPVTAPVGGPEAIMEIYFEIKEDTPLETSVNIDLFSDFTSGGIIIFIYDLTGLEGVEPTLVDGTIIVKDTTLPPEPEAPVFYPLTTPITVVQGGKVTFTVTAYDPDGKDISISATNIPSGATFPTVSADSIVTGTFNWASAAPGTWTVTFRAEDADDDVTTRSVTIIVEEILTDELIVASTESEGTAGGIAGTPGVAVPIDLQNIQTIYGIQFDLAFDDNICDYDSVTSTERLPGFTVYENLLGPGQLRIVTFGANNEEVVAGSSGNTILYLWFSITASATPGYYPLTLSNVYESIDPDPGSSSVEMTYNTDGVLAVDMLGDVNLHPPVDVADLVSLVGYIIGDWPLTTRQFRAANVNGDTEANVVDLVNILNYVLGMQPSPMPLMAYNGPDAVIDAVIGDLAGGQNGLMRIEAELPADVGGVQLEIGYDPGKVKLDAPQLSERADGFVLKYRDEGGGKMIVLMHYQKKNSGMITAGLGEILTIPVQAIEDLSTTSGEAELCISDVVLSSAEGAEIPVKGYDNPAIPRQFNLAQNYPNPFNPRTTIVFEVLSSNAHPGGSDIELVVYNILGQKVKTLAAGYYSPGEYSVVWDGTDDFGKSQASGVYFYSLISGDTRTTKKMALTK